MRESSAFPITEAKPLTWSGWRYALAMYVLALAVVAFMSLVLGQLIGEPHLWVTSNDIWSITHAAQYAGNGGLGSIYAVSPWYAALPGYLLIYAPVTMIGDHFNLVTGYPFSIAHPSMFVLTGPFFAFTGATVVLGVDYLADSLAIERRRRRMVGLAVALFIAGPVPIFLGHPEDMVALGLAALAFGLLFRGRPVGAAFALSFAILFQTWAVLLIPAAVIAVAPNLRWRTLVRILALPAVMGATFLITDFHDTVTDVVHQPMADAGQHLPWWSVAARMNVTDLENTYHGLVSGSTTRWPAVVVAVLVAWPVRHRPTGQDVLMVAAVAMFARGFFEAEYFAYYFAPATVFLWLMAADRGTGTKRFTVAMTTAFLLYASAPMAESGVRFSPWIALFNVTATGGLALAATVGRPRPNRRPELVPPDLADLADLSDLDVQAGKRTVPL